MSSKFILPKYLKDAKESLIKDALEDSEIEHEFSYYSMGFDHCASLMLCNEENLKLEIEMLNSKLTRIDDVLSDVNEYKHLKDK